jgi:hypothetical protein
MCAIYAVGLSLTAWYFFQTLNTVCRYGMRLSGGDTTLWAKKNMGSSVTELELIYWKGRDDDVNIELGVHSMPTRDQRNNTCFVHNFTNALACALGVEKTPFFSLLMEVVSTVAKTANIAMCDSTFCPASEDSDFKTAVGAHMRGVLANSLHHLGFDDCPSLLHTHS